MIITCEACEGKRFKPRSQGSLSGEEYFRDPEMTGRSYGLFPGSFRILSKLQVLKEVGLGYLVLGQSTNTLSGGESQRLKLALHIGRSLAGRNLFIFDEPTTGLHLADVELLLKTFQRLLLEGHSIVVIEHILTHPVG
jgi:excinuclease ABC subunit A